jgi:hypothetical protein
MSVTEQRYQAVLEVIGEGRTVSEVAGHWRVDRRTSGSPRPRRGSKLLMGAPTWR